ncbi:Aminoalkylphosphonate N-acetyltransferase [bioreactor metagenome]|uniref:Aminoalkylphosphonate N-acetyltransferase n=1 Tax=bioreactor metagenome TaxID=1076179 RepID=A0A645EQC4_9ZZZZ
MIIRKADINDINIIYGFIADLEERTLDAVAFASIYQHNLENPDVFYLVAELDNQLVGFISMHIQYLLHHSAKVAEIAELFVVPSCRGQHIGKQLFDNAVELAKKQDCVSLEVASSQKRTRAHAFYRKQGMQNSHLTFTISI